MLQNIRKFANIRQQCRSINLSLKFKTILKHDILKLMTNYLVMDDNFILKEVFWCINQLSENPAKIINLILKDETFMMNLLELLFKSSVSKKVITSND